MPQKINHSYNYIETQNENDFNNRSTYNLRNLDKDRMPSEIKQLEKLKQLKKHKLEREREKEMQRQRAREENRENIENSVIHKKSHFLDRVNTKIMSTISKKLNDKKEENNESSYFTKKRSGDLNLSQNESRDVKAPQSSRESKGMPDPQQAEVHELSYDDLPAESKISRTVSDTITKKIIIIILLLLFLP